MEEYISEEKPDLVVRLKIKWERDIINLISLVRWFVWLLKISTNG